MKTTADHRVAFGARLRLSAGRTAWTPGEWRLGAERQNRNCRPELSRGIRDRSSYLVQNLERSKLFPAKVG
jgi:hypothetical protein